LYCNNTKISDLTALKGCPKLKELNISDTKVADAEVLKKLNFLRKVYVKNTLISKQIVEENKDVDVENN